MQTILLLFAKKIRLNSNKTEIIAFTKSIKMIQKLKDSPVAFDGLTLHWKEMVKNLGVILDQKLLFKHHIDWVTKKANNMIRTLYPLLKRNSKAQKETKIHAYRAVVRPILTYACPIFANCAECHFRKLQIQQNKILRMALNADFFTKNIEIHKKTNIPTVREFVDKISSNFYTRAKSHKNPLVSTLGMYSRESLEFGVKHRLPRSI
jgi:hypothetical protein